FLVVVVQSPALPAASLVEQGAVSVASECPPPAVGEGVARWGSMSARSLAAYDLESSRESGISTKSGSPRYALRSAYARRIASVWRCISRALPNGGRGAYPSITLTISARVTPPPEG